MKSNLTTGHTEQHAQAQVRRIQQLGCSLTLNTNQVALIQQNLTFFTPARNQIVLEA
jgi:hypothetical protein